VLSIPGARAVRSWSRSWFFNANFARDSVPDTLLLTNSVIDGTARHETAAWTAFPVLFFLATGPSTANGPQSTTVTDHANQRDDPARPYGRTDFSWDNIDVIEEKKQKSEYATGRHAGTHSFSIVDRRRGHDGVGAFSCAYPTASIVRSPSTLQYERYPRRSVRSWMQSRQSFRSSDVRENSNERRLNRPTRGPIAAYRYRRARATSSVFTALSATDRQQQVRENASGERSRYAVSSRWFWRHDVKRPFRSFELDPDGSASCAFTNAFETFDCSEQNKTSSTASTMAEYRWSAGNRNYRLRAGGTSVRLIAGGRGRRGGVTTTIRPAVSFGRFSSAGGEPSKVRHCDSGVHVRLVKSIW